MISDKCKSSSQLQIQIDCLELLSQIFYLTLMLPAARGTD